MENRLPRRLSCWLALTGCTHGPGRWSSAARGALRPLFGRPRCGASEELIGVCVLAEKLAYASGDHRAAFTNYEKTMRPSVVDQRPRAAKAGAVLHAPPIQEMLDALAANAPKKPCTESVLLRDSTAADPLRSLHREVRDAAARPGGGALVAAERADDSWGRSSQNRFTDR